MTAKVARIASLTSPLPQRQLYTLSILVKGEVKMANNIFHHNGVI